MPLINLNPRKTLIENLCDRKLKTLRTNNGLEFYNATFDMYCNIKAFKDITLSEKPHNIMEWLEE